MRFPIRRKIFLLTALLSIAFIVVSVVTSSLIYNARMRASVMDQCEKSTKRLAEDIEQTKDGFLTKYKDKLLVKYENNYEDILKYSSDVTYSFEEKKEFFDELVSDLFPPKGAFGVTYEMIEFKNDYEDTLRSLDLIASSEGMIGGFIAFEDPERDNLVFMLDSTSNVSYQYNFPCSIERIVDQGIIDTIESGGIKKIESDDAFYCYAPIHDSDGNVVAYVSFYYSISTLMENQRQFIWTLIFIMLGATVFMLLAYLLTANKFIVKNIKKLSDSAIKFSSNLESDGKPEAVPVDIKTNDEIGALSDNFNVLQTRMITYIDDIANKTAQEERMQAELNIASKIQIESLPDKPLEKKNTRISSFIKPAKEVGGDLFDYFLLDDDHLFFVIADVSGKGVPAALFMMRGNEIIRSCATRGMGTSEIAEYANNELFRNNKEGLFITAFIGILDLKTKVLKYTRAGHEQPFLLRDGVAEKISEESNYVLGGFPKSKYIEDSIELKDGDKILMYTDGVNEGINGTNEEFGYDRIKETLESSKNDTLENMFNNLTEFASGVEQFDDITMLLLEIGKSARVELSNPTYNDIERVTEIARNTCSGADAEKLSEMSVIIDELLNNCISYSFADVDDPKLIVDVEYVNEKVTLTFTDNGILFNPLEAKPTDVDVDISERKIGGLGIMLVKDLSDKMEYSSKDGKNELKVIKKMTA